MLKTRYIDFEIINVSQVMKTMFEDLGFDEDDEDIVPLPNVNSRTLRVVVQWTKHVVPNLFGSVSYRITIINC